MFPSAFLDRPIAHRGFHDLKNGRPENSREAILAAVDQGYCIEIDLQITADRRALVFHDYKLDRLTGAIGKVSDRTVKDLETIPLTGSPHGPPLLSDVLRMVNGRVPLLIEVKDQDGALGENVGALEDAVAGDLDGYRGTVAVMSFNPHSVAAFQALLPDIPRGLVTEDFTRGGYPLPEERIKEVTTIADYDRVGACFFSHDWRDLEMPRVAELKAGGATVLCWTVRSPEQEAKAREIADNVTFEGYTPVEAS